mgnify:CR=1 FL=1
MAALSVFQQPIVLICGGYDKHIPLNPMIPSICEKSVYVSCTGQTGGQIYDLLVENGYKNAVYNPKFDDAVAWAFAHAQPGDAVLLSPAAASFDAFANFEKRGEHFVDLVKAYVTKS